MDNPVSKETLSILFETLLGRMLADPKEASEALNRGWDLRRWIIHLCLQIDHQRRMLAPLGHSVFWDDPNNKIEYICSEETYKIFESRLQISWEHIGSSVPFFSSFMNPKYLSGNLAGSDIEEFYQTGRIEVDAIKKRMLRHNLWPKPGGLVLDWGCGLGRLAQHFSADNVRYLGVDLSATILAAAEARMSRVGEKNATFIQRSIFFEERHDEKFDAIFSILVFQHMPPPLMARELRRVLEKLRPGGGAYIQLPVFLYDYRFSVNEYLLNLPPVGSIEMHALPQVAVFEIIQQLGHQVLEVIFDGRAAAAGWSYGFLIRGGFAR